MLEVLKRISGRLLRSTDVSASGAESYSRYRELVHRFIQRCPTRMIEVGVWRGDRSCEFLKAIPGLREYVGFDLFEQMTADVHQHEGMANCFAVTMDDVQERLDETK